jgi:cytosine/uracil/thiamine/allantoin permease
VKGNARQVFSRGELVVDGGKFIGTVGRGKYLHREARCGDEFFTSRGRRADGCVRPARRPALYNADLAPTTPEQRTWGTYNYIALWFSMSMEVTTYMLASSLIAGGMNWKQAIGTILLGNLIVLIPMLLNAHAGAKYGIPFPVFVRASFGVRGANIPAMLRAIVACGWFGIQSWIGGQAIARW